MQPEDWWAIENWPVKSQAATEALPALSKTHKVVAVPAYDMNGDLIHPLFYRTRLSGAVAEIAFELSHWSMRSRGAEPACDTFAADLVAVRILLPPKLVAVTPWSRKVVHKPEPLAAPTAGPSKRPRLAEDA